MIWSYSAAKMFRQCQLQWFLKTKVANAKAKAPVRREAYLLSKLQSLWAWRGYVVDQLLSTEIMKALYYRHPIHLYDLLSNARSSFTLQADFALRHRIRDVAGTRSPSNLTIAICAMRRPTTMLTPLTLQNFLKTRRSYERHWQAFQSL